MIKHVVFVLSLISILASGASADKLLQSTDLTYLGAFRTPTNYSSTCQNFTNGGRSLAFYPRVGKTYGTLYITNHKLGSCVSEIEIPDLVDYATSGADASKLNTASVLQTGVNVVNGNAQMTGAGGTSCTNQHYLGGLLVYNGALIGTTMNPYGGSCPVLSHWENTLTMSAPNFLGLYQISSGSYNANFVSAYQTIIPTTYQLQLGGKTLTGGSDSSQIATSSMGPAIFAYDPVNLGVSPASANMLLGYPFGHQTLCSNTNTLTQYCSYADQNGTMTGVIFPDNSRTVIFSGTRGTGTYGYGPASSNPAQTCIANGSGNCDGLACGSTTVPAGESCSYEPTNNTSQGVHAYPYADSLWFYDVGNSDGSNSSGNTAAHNGWTSGTKCNTLTAVKLGASSACGVALNPWDILPYSVVSLTQGEASNPFPVPNQRNFGGIAYDPANKKMYLATGSGSQGTIIQVYSVNDGTETTPTYNITATAGANGSLGVGEGSQSIAFGSTASITATPNAGYQIGSLTGGDCPAGSWSGMTYTTGAITGDCSIGTVNFTALAPVGRSVKRISAGMW